MSAIITRFPERQFRPNADEIAEILDGVEQGSGAFLEIAMLAMQRLQAMRGNDNPTAEDMQAATNAIALACFALALELGIPRETIFDSLEDGR